LILIKNTILKDEKKSLFSLIAFLNENNDFTKNVKHYFSLISR